MSAGQRAKARAAREAERAREREKAAKSRERKAKVASLKPELPRPQKRYGAMPLRTRLGLAFGFLTVQFVGWQVLGGAGQRLGLALLSLLALPLVVTLYFSPRSSR